MSSTISTDTMTHAEAAEEVLYLYGGDRPMTTGQILSEIEDMGLVSFNTDQPYSSLNTTLTAHSDKPYPSSPGAEDVFERIPQGKKSKGCDLFRLSQ